MHRSLSRAALLAATILMGGALVPTALAQEQNAATAAPPRAASAAEQAPTAEKPVEQPAAPAAYEPEWRPGWVVTAHPRAGIDLTTVNSSAYARYVDGDSNFVITETQAKIPLKDVYAPSGVMRTAHLNIEEDGNYVLSVDAYPTKDRNPTMCATRVAVMGADAISNPSIFFNRDASQPVRLTSQPLALTAGAYEIAWWTSCYAAGERHGADKDFNDRDVAWGEHNRFFGMKASTNLYSPTKADRQTTLADAMGVEFRLLISKPDGSGAEAPKPQNIIYDAKAAPAAPAGAMPVQPTGKSNLGNGYAPGWAVQGFAFADVKKWMDDDARDAALFEFGKRNSTFSLKDNLTAKMGEAKPDVFKASSNFVARETGQYLFAVAFTSDWDRDNFLRCGVALNMDGIDKPLIDAIDKTAFRGHGLTMGSAMLSPGGYPVALRMACDPKGLVVDHKTRLFRDTESGVTFRVLVKAPSDEMLRAPTREEFIALLPKGAVIGAEPPAAKPTGPVKVNVPKPVGKVEAPKTDTGADEIANALAAIGSEINLTVTFATSSDVLEPQGRKQVAELGRALQKLKARVMVEGHTDSVGDDAANQKLSERRALAVMRELNEIRYVSTRMRQPGLEFKLGTPVRSKAPTPW